MNYENQDMVVANLKKILNQFSYGLIKTAKIHILDVTWPSFEPRTLRIQNQSHVIRTECSNRKGFDQGTNQKAFSKNGFVHRTNYTAKYNLKTSDKNVAHGALVSYSEFHGARKQENLTAVGEALNTSFMSLRCLQHVSIKPWKIIFSRIAKRSLLVC